MKKVLKKLLISVFVFIIAILIQNVCKATSLTTKYYKIDDKEKIIYEIEPETEIDTFKIRLSVISSETGIEDVEQAKEEIKVYKDKTYKEEVKNGFVGTGMILKKNDTEYELSVIGDFDGDGKATQVELANTIRHIVGLKGSKLEGIKYKSADLTLDGQVDQRDITKFIKYIVYGELDLGKKDTTPPILDIELIKQAISEITVRVTAIDKESGMGENPTFTFYKKKENEPESAYIKKQSGKETILNITDLEVDTAYTIKVETQDKSGNKTEKTIIVRTKKIPGGVEEGAIQFGELTWQNGTASTTIETDKLIPIWEKETGDNTTEKFQIEYQINGTTGKWIKGNKVTGLEHGDVLYARLTDGINAGDSSNIKILDEIKPKVTLNLQQSKDKTIIATASAVDDETGIDEEVTYKFSIKETESNDSTYVEIQNTIENTCDFTGLEVEKNYTIKVEVEDKAGNVGIQEKDILIPDDIAPVITQLTATTNSIEITATDEGVGITGYAVTTSKTEPSESDYITVESTTEFNITATEKTQGTKYYVWVKDAVGNVSKSKSIETGTVTELTTSNTTFTYSPEQEIWTNESVTVTANTTATGYTLQTSKDGTTWSDTASQTFTENGTVYARLWDGTNAGTTISENVTNIDTLEPKAFTPTAESTTKSITVTAVAEDAEATSTSGKSGIAGYRFKLDSEDWTEYQESGTYTWDSLTQATNHTITVETKDNAGNTKTGTVTKGTETVTGLTTSNTTFTYNPAQGTWTNGNVTATASTTVISDTTTTGYTIQTSKDGTTWTSTESQTFTENGQIYARLWDGKNGGTATSGNVTNIDTLEPKAFTPTATSTTKSITVNASTEDAEATNTSGKSGIAGYRFKLDSGNWTEYQTSGTYTWDSLTQATNYTITVEAKDNAGNTKTGTVTKGTETVTGLTTSNTTFTYNPAQGTWTNGSVTATASTTVISDTTTTGYTLQTSKDGTTWTSTESQTFTENGQIYARLWDGKNGGTATSGNVTNIDTLEPKAFTPTAESTTKSITVTASTEDADKTTTSGKSGISGYRFKLDNGNWTEYQTSGTYTWNNLTQTTNHTITVEAKDNAGNTKTGTVTKSTGTVTALTTANTTFSYSPAQGTWTKGSVTATASTTATGYTLQTSKDGTNWSSTATQTFTTNGKVYARLWDGTNGGTATSGNVTNIDTLVPNAFTPTATSTTKSITVTASATDADATSTNGKSNIAGYRFKLDSGNWTEYQTSGTYTWNNLTQTTNHTITVEAKDNAGNTKTGTVTKGTGTVTALTTANTTFSYSPAQGTWTNGVVTATVSTTATGYTLQTSKDGTNWSSTATQTFTTNGKVYARLWDGTNGGTATSGNVTNIDTTKPIVTGATSTYNSISITATDEASGIVGYEVTTSSSTPSSSSFTSCTSTKALSKTVTGKTADTTYYVWVKDQAGNISISKSIKTQVIPTTVPAATITEAQSDDMLEKTVNSPIQDEYGNPITIPAGFKMKVDSDTNNATTVDKGIVIIDSAENEFVWIPVGTITTSNGTKTIDLNRYGLYGGESIIKYNDEIISTMFQEVTVSGWGNRMAKDINVFKASATTNGGYYIGRYEARESSSNVITEKGTDTVWNYITQPNAATLSMNMYGSNKTFTSDLINSYAWDTSILFLQTCGTNSEYCNQTSINTSLETTGTNNKTIKDVQCNVYDMAGNVAELTTETNVLYIGEPRTPVVYRGGYYGNPNYNSMSRSHTSYSMEASVDFIGFRPILYVIDPEPATTMTEAQEDKMLTKTVNSTIQDVYGNKITIPAGFKIKVDSDTNNATTVDKGIVIIDGAENEFVWIPVGTINTSNGTKTIDLNRYTFDSNGNPTAQNDAIVESYFQELATSSYGNETAEDINAFKTSVTKNGGYYIGRYEARKHLINNNVGIVTEKRTDTVWNEITQSNASTKGRNMHNSTKPFISDLINSYAWDTAIVFLQQCGDDPVYSIKKSLYTLIATKGTNNAVEKDVQCNVYDMSSNITEWTTETSIHPTGGSCIARGGNYYNSESYYTCMRIMDIANHGMTHFGFRPILYF